MILSLSWIKDYVSLPDDADLNKLAYDLTMDTVEVEDVEYLGKRFENMVVGVIKAVNPHPNADKLAICSRSWIPPSRSWSSRRSSTTRRSRRNGAKAKSRDCAPRTARTAANAPRS